MGRKSAQSQPTPRKNKSDNGGFRSQRSIADMMRPPEVDLDKLVNDCVRYIIYRAGHHLPFRKSELQKNCIPGSLSARNFEEVIRATANILKETYGYNLILCDGNNSNRCYIVSNALPFISNDDPNEEYSVENENLPEDTHKIVLLLVLAHIYMCNNILPEGSLHNFLKSFGIIHDRKHKVFGNIKEYLSITLPKQRYIEIQKDSISGKLKYAWGERAEKEISKMEILKFVCKIYKDTKPKAWSTQYQAAMEQGFENTQLTKEAAENGDADAE